MSGRIFRRIGCGAALAVATLGMAACSSDGSGSSAATEPANQETVAVKLFQFQPQSTQVVAGTEVVWENGDDTVHQPTSGAPAAIQPTFDVKIEGVGATGSYTFTEPGSYPYFCQLHTSMTGEVVVS